VGSCVAAAWPLALWSRGLGAPWFREFIVGENFGKFQGTRDSVVEMLSGFGVLLVPWTVVVVAVLWRIGQDRAWRDPDVAQPLAFIGANVAVFSLPAVKWSQYLLPSVPMNALLVAWTARAGVSRPLQIAGTITALPLVALVPVLLATVRLVDGTVDRLLLLALACSIFAAAYCFVQIRFPRGAAVAVACAFVLVAFLAPRLTLRRPDNLAQAAQGRELVVFGVPPYAYEVALRRPVSGVSVPADLHESVGRGAMFIASDSDLSELRRNGAVDPDRTETVLCWRNWKKGLTMPTILRNLRVGDRLAFTENVCLLRPRAE
jgi:hypothetical protein